MAIKNIFQDKEIILFDITQNILQAHKVTRENVHKILIDKLEFYYNHSFKDKYQHYYNFLYLNFDFVKKQLVN